ncbi:MAG: metallophosphoesterase family protein [Acetobacteraceae bacterium]
MPTIRLWQVSDTHLSAEHPFFQPNWDAFARLAETGRPDLVVHAGDLALEAPERPGDLDRGHASLAALACEWLAIPGNHDIGDNVAPGHAPKRPVSATLLNAWHERFGACRWSRDIGAWRIIGLNAQLMAEEPPADLAGHAAAQWAFLEQALDTPRPVLLFMHKPLFETTPDLPSEPSLRYVPPGPAARLRHAITSRGVRIVASGHVHQHRRLSFAGTEYVWAPATAFTLPDRLQAPVGDKALGFVAFDLHDDGTADISIETPPAFAANDITDFPDAYPKPVVAVADAG